MVMELIGIHRDVSANFVRRIASSSGAQSLAEVAVANKVMCDW